MSDNAAVLQLFFGLASLAWSATLTVGSTGEYTTLEDAVGAAQSGDILELAAGQVFAIDDIEVDGLTIRGDPTSTKPTIT